MKWIDYRLFYPKETLGHVRHRSAGHFVSAWVFWPSVWTQAAVEGAVEGAAGRERVPAVGAEDLQPSDGCGLPATESPACGEHA